MSAAVHQTSSDPTRNTLESLSPQQAQVVAALAQGSTVTRAASAAGVHRTTVHHWLRTSPEFKLAIQEAKRLYAASIEDELAELSAAALQTLRALIESPETHPAVRLKAALAVLERPHFPNPSWQLPVETGTRSERELMKELAELEADIKKVARPGFPSRAESEQ